MTCFDSTTLRLKNAFQNSRQFSVSSLMVVLLLERRLPETECSSVDSSLVKKKKKEKPYLLLQHRSVQKINICRGCAGEKGWIWLHWCRTVGGKAWNLLRVGVVRERPSDHLWVSPLQRLDLGIQSLIGLTAVALQSDCSVHNLYTLQ